MPLVVFLKLLGGHAAGVDRERGNAGVQRLVELIDEDAVHNEPPRDRIGDVASEGIGVRHRDRERGREPIVDGHVDRMHGAGALDASR